MKFIKDNEVSLIRPEDIVNMYHDDVSAEMAKAVFREVDRIGLKCVVLDNFRNYEQRHDIDVDFEEEHQHKG